jgi:hypothetical protein
MKTAVASPTPGASLMPQKNPGSKPPHVVP